MLTVIHLFLFLVSFLLTFKFIKDSNFEKLFKKGRISEIRASYVLVSFILGSVFSFFIVKLVETVSSLIFK